MSLQSLATNIDSWICNRAWKLACHNPMPSAQDIQILDLPDARIRALVTGRGPDVVMVPDPPNTIEHHAELIEHFQHNYRVVCFELPGFGLSYPKRSMAWTLAGQAAVFEQVFAALDISGALLAISCLGAYVGVEFALRYRHRIGTLALIQAVEIPQAIAWSRKADVGGLIATPIIGQIFTRLLQKQIIRQWYKSALGPEQNNARCRLYTDLALDAARHGSCFSLASAYQILQTEPVINWRLLSQPTLLVHGVLDPSHTETQWETLARAVSNCRYVRFDNSAHFPNLEEPGRFVRLIRDWHTDRASSEGGS
jgi:pimeloyl-ACP methyl ester carboxylesterase